MRAEAGQAAGLRRDVGRDEGGVDLGDRQLLVFGLSLQSQVLDELGFGLGVLDAAVLAGGDAGLVHLAGLGEPLDGLDDSRAGAGLLAVLGVELSDGVADLGDGHGLTGRLGGDHGVDDDGLFGGLELAAMAAGGEDGLEDDVGLGAHGLFLWNGMGVASRDDGIYHRVVSRYEDGTELDPRHEMHTLCLMCYIGVEFTSYRITLLLSVWTILS